jgi:hypothetical protein
VTSSASRSSSSASRASRSLLKPALLLGDLTTLKQFGYGIGPHGTTRHAQTGRHGETHLAWVRGLRRSRAAGDAREGLARIGGRRGRHRRQQLVSGRSTSLGSPRRFRRHPPERAANRGRRRAANRPGRDTSPPRPERSSTERREARRASRWKPLGKDPPTLPRVFPPGSRASTP